MRHAVIPDFVGKGILKYAPLGQILISALVWSPDFAAPAVGNLIEKTEWMKWFIWRYFMQIANCFIAKVLYITECRYTYLTNCKILLKEQKQCSTGDIKEQESQFIEITFSLAKINYF